MALTNSVSATHTYVHVQTLGKLSLKGQFKMRKCKKPQMQKKVRFKWKRKMLFVIFVDK